MRRLTVLALGAAALAAGCGEDRREPQRPAVRAPAPAPFEPVAPARVAASQRHDGHLVARVRRPTALRRAPAGLVVARVERRTEFGSPTVLAVVARRDGWLKVMTALLPNGRRAWVRERAVRLATTPYDVRVDRSRRRAVLRRNGRPVLRFRVAVGRPGNETPLGRFAVTDRLRPDDPASPYGCCIVALTGHQTKLVPGWPGGDRLAIHGTPSPETVGRAASLGCMRAHRRSIERLMRRVPLGSPVRVVA